MIINTLWGEEEVIQTKTCCRCGETKHKDDFAYRSYNKNGDKEYKNYCKDCDKIATKQVDQLKKQYPFPNKDKDYICPICERREEALKHRRAWVLDHNHVTKQFRGWICNHCNTGLSRFNDDINVLQNAIKYLKQDLEL